LPKGPGITVYFEDKNMDKVVNHLKEKGVTIVSEPEDKPWLWREAHLKDPDGNNIILYYAGAYRKHPPWRINT